MKSRIMLVGGLVLSLLPGLVSFALAQDSNKLTVEQVIASALAVSAKPEETTRYDWPLSEIAKAHLYRGEIATARRMLGNPSESAWEHPGFIGCVEIELSVTGRVTLFTEPPPAGYSGAAFLAMAEAHVRRGEAAQAIAALRRMDPATSFYPRLIAERVTPKLRELDRQAALDALNLQAANYRNGNDVASRGETLESLVGEYLACDAKEPALAFCRRWEHLAEELDDVEDWGKYIGLSWARLSRSYKLAGDSGSAKRCLAAAAHWLDLAIAQDEQDNRKRDYLDEASTWGLFGACQLRTSGEDSARAAYQRAWNSATQMIQTDFGYYGFEKVLNAQLTSDDLAGAYTTIGLVKSSRTLSRCWVILSKYHQEHGRLTEALKAARQANESLQMGKLGPPHAEPLANVALCFAQAEDQVKARELFSRAVELSESDGENGSHQWIARMQVQAHHFDDAWRTCQGIPEMEYRSLPLAELAREMAKSQFMEKRTGKP